VILNKIFVVRGQKVMIDRDLAELYEIETKVLKQQVKRNIERFTNGRFVYLSVYVSYSEKKIPRCVTNDRYSQIAMNQINNNYMLLSKFLYSGHTTLVPLSTGYRGRRGSWFAPNPG
jgi:hypothetical protein